MASPASEAGISSTAKSPANDEPSTNQQPPASGRERSDSSAPLAKRVKTDHTVTTAAPTNDPTNGARTASHPPSAPFLPAVPSSSSKTINGAQEQKDNLESLVDVMGSSGIDLRAEEEAIQRRELMQQSQTTTSNSHHSDDELYLQVYPLAFKVHTIAQKHGLSVDAAVLNYLSLAARLRLKNLLESMISSSRHRNWSSHQHPPPLFPSSNKPMYHEQILADPVKQLAALEKAERGDEARRRRERLARDEEATASASGLAGDSADVEMGDAAGTPGADLRKKPKKIGPGVAAKNMSEDVRKRLADSTAMRNLGGGASKYSWLSGGSNFAGSFGSAGNKKAKMDASDDSKSTGRLPKPKFAPQPAISGWSGSSKAESGPSASGTLGSHGAWGDVAARQAAKEEEERQARLRVTMRDALFALEYERRGGAGYGSGEALLYRLRAGDDRFLNTKNDQL